MYFDSVILDSNIGDKSKDGYMVVIGLSVIAIHACED
jgi:hypothetical protein